MDTLGRTSLKKDSGVGGLTHNFRIYYRATLINAVVVKRHRSMKQS